MSLLNFDEINQLNIEYYEPMQVSDVQKSERTELAGILYSFFWMLLMDIQDKIDDNPTMTSTAMVTLVATYIGGCKKILKDYGFDFDKYPYLESYSNDIVNQVVKTTVDGTIDKISVGTSKIVKKDNVDNLPNNQKQTLGSTSDAVRQATKTETQPPKTSSNIPKRTFSQARAIEIAQNEANRIFNYADFTDAVESGLTTKTWLTMQDEKVRETHVEVNNVSIPINELFTVGEYEMEYPLDMEHGAGAEEIVNCRCSVEYR